MGGCIAWMGMCLSLWGSPGLAALSPQQVLVIYNSRSDGSEVVLNAYLAAHPDIPAANVFDLNAPGIANMADITYGEFVSYVRDPIRGYLSQTGSPTAEAIVSLCLVRGVPHRIKDTNNPTVGDNPSAFVNEFNAGDVTCASVDSELVLLWQDLNSGEAGGNMDSYADNLIVNPYHKSTAGVNTFDRSYIRNAKSFSKSGLAWKTATGSQNRLTPGDMYLVSRIDGTTAAHATSIIARAQHLRVNRKYAWIILDEDARANQLDDDDYLGLFGSAPDYENTRDQMTDAGFNVLYDNTSMFVLPGNFIRPVIAYASYGTNHQPSPPGSGTYIEGFRFPPGAIFNTYESYNGRAFNGLGTLFGQEQITDFTAVGGTFAVGHVWEPFTFSVADNEYVLSAMFIRNMTWAEAAWSAIPALSWMHIVVGDPLARVVQVVDQPADFDADVDVDHADFVYLQSCATGPGLGPPVPACVEADLTGDGHIDQLDFAAFQRCISATGSTLKPDCAD